MESEFPSSDSLQASITETLMSMESAAVPAGWVGLTTLFGQVVRAWGFPSAKRSFAEEFALQQVKLDIEKTLFLQWGRRTGIILLEDESPAAVDPRIADNSPQTQKAVSSILSSMKNLLSDSRELESKYGIAIEEGTETESKSRGISNSLMDAFENWQRQVTANQNGTTVWQKTRWVCRDRDKFVTFVNEMNSFNLKLSSLTPQAPFIHQLLVQHIVYSLRNDLSTLNLVRKATITSYPDLSEAAKQQIRVSESYDEGHIVNRERQRDEADPGTQNGGPLWNDDSWRIATPEDIVHLIGQEIDGASGAIKMLINSPIRKHEHKGEVPTPVEQLYTLAMRLNLQKYKLKSLTIPEQMIKDLRMACREWVEQARRVRKSATQVARCVPRYPDGIDALLEQNALAVESDLELLKTNLEYLVTNTFGTM